MVSALAALALTLAFGASQAAAVKVPQFDFGASGGEGGQFGAARGIAVNESGEGGVAAGTIYVIEFNGNRVQSFDADGNFIRAWGWDVIEAGDPNDTGEEFEICEVTTECKGGAKGEGAGQFDRAAGGIAVDQSSGDVYVLDRGNSRIQQFEAEGGFVSEWGSAGEAAGQFGFGSTVAIAGLGADSFGNIYVADAGNARVQKFDSEGGVLRTAGWDVVESGPNDDTIADPEEDEYEVCVPAEGDVCKAGTTGSGEGQYGNGNLPSFLAASSCGGDIYVVGRTDGTVYHLDDNLEFIEEYLTTAGSNNNRNAMAVNCADGHLFFTERETSTVFELNPETGEVVDEHEAEDDQWVGLAINPLTGRMYGTRTVSASFVRVWDDIAGALPEAEACPPSVNSGTKATICGTVDPNEIELDECFFEWGATAAYGQIAPCVPGPGGIGSGDDPVAVEADIGELTPNGTTYHYRLRAFNENGQDTSEDEGFTTADTVFTEAASEVTPSTAILNGFVDPDGEGVVECEFEWGTTTAYGQIAPCVPGPGGIGSGDEPVAVEADIAGLEHGSHYHFRLRAKYASGGVARGADQSLLTLGPTVGDAWSQDVGLAEATLKAKINPQGRATVFHFEYGIQGPCSSNLCASAPLPDGTAGSDSETHEVDAALERLKVGTTYHWRVVAESEDATSFGPDQLFTTYASLAYGPCANDAFRVGPSTGLPDCRAYEMVSPPDKNGGDIIALTEINGINAAWQQASTDGNRLTYTSSSAFGDAVSGAYSSQYLSTRGAGGWSTHGLNPPQGTTVFDPGQSTRFDLNINFLDFSDDLCRAVLKDHNLVPLTEDAIAGYTNVYVRENCGAQADTFRALSSGGAPAFSFRPQDLGLFYASFSPGGHRVLFGAEATLDSSPAPAPNAEAQLYDYDLQSGELRLVSTLPGGEADPGASALGSSYESFSHNRYSRLAQAVSEDGSRVYWTSQPGVTVDGTIYASVEGAPTVQVSAGGDASFLAAASDGSKAVYEEQGSGNSVISLREFDLDSEARTEISADAGGLVGASDDLSRIYFTSEEALAAGASAGEWNLYLREKGGVSFIAAVSRNDRGEDVGFNDSTGGIDRPLPYARRAHTSADGRVLVFMSNRSLTGYDNADAHTGEALSEVYRFDAAANGGEGGLSCLSCNPSGARPVGQGLPKAYRRVAAPNELQVAAWLPTCEWSNRCPRVLTSGGERVFFNSFDALVPEDTNGAQDVYQWEAPGTGTCTTSDPRYFAENGGCIALVSTGHSPKASEFLDADTSGRDAFFTTESDVDPRDLGSIDVYDARAGGGFPPPPPPAPPCVGDACQSVPAPPARRTPASAAFRGPGDPAPRGNCAGTARRAAGLARRAKRLRKTASRSAPRRARRLRRRAKDLAERARRASRNAKRCRHANRRAGR